ncbi:DUF418 domain-containing protein [Segetibacter aerophilus]|uniref:DUF418 domain-containing protein n=1 Tax=Segetibacter aerophilus TaxID=670293 RepID=A0A512B821_9BACT|nr:DUF418 domain-containing protein [Segetibacter aerophilus]GEO08059.1 hypothetical protein SAE01_05550 [Segetibacter aerophilus]
MITTTGYSATTTLPLDASISPDETVALPKLKPRPVGASERIQTIDMVRGFALLGILLMNIPGFGIDGSAFYNIINGPHNTADYYTLAIVTSFFDGTMRGLFSMLFGAGMVLFTLSKKEVEGGASVAEYYYRRLLWLVLFGVLNAYVLLWEGDILFYYGLFGMLLYPFRKTAPKWLFLIGLACFATGHFKQQMGYAEFREKRLEYVKAIAAEKSHQKLTEKQKSAKAAWEEIEKNRKPDMERTAENVSERRGGYATVFTHFADRNGSLETMITYHFWPDMLGMMFIGMALFRLGFFSNKLTTSSYGLLLLVGYGIGIPIGWIFFSKGVAVTDIGRYLDAHRVPHGALYDLRRLLLSLGHASLLMLIYRSQILPRLMKVLANVGQMAFTNYLMQSIICTLIFHGYGLGYYNQLKFHQLYYIVGAVWIFQMIFSYIWMRYYRFGPFEWLWRSLTYWKMQPMRLTARAVA